MIWTSKFKFSFRGLSSIHFNVFYLFSEPNDESAANVDAAKTWRENRMKFEEIAAKTVRKSLGL